MFCLDEGLSITPGDAPTFYLPKFATPGSFRGSVLRPARVNEISEKLMENPELASQPDKGAVDHC